MTGTWPYWLRLRLSAAGAAHSFGEAVYAAPRCLPRTVRLPHRLAGQFAVMSLEWQSRVRGRKVCFW
jgi:hypothetical protein